MTLSFHRCSVFVCQFNISKLNTKVNKATVSMIPMTMK